MKLKIISLTLLIFCLTIPASYGQDFLSGALSGTIGPGTYLVNGDCEILNGTTLTILPGTTLKHQGHFTWTITGQLIAEGTETDSIKFVREQPISSNNWGGLRFSPTIPVQNNLFYCVVEWAVNSGICGGGIYIMGNHLTIKNSRISHNAINYPNEGGGVYAYYASTLLMEECLVNYNDGMNGGGGIYLNFSHGAQINNCIITHNIALGT